MPGASPDTMATTVATPLERHLGVIADVSEMTSSSTVGSTRITLQFDLDRNIDGAARDVAGGDQRRARRSADQPAPEPDLPQGQPGRRADRDPVADLRHADPRPDLRCGLDGHAAGIVADRRHRPGRDRRQLAAGGAGRAQPAGAVQIRDRPRRRARRARLGQRPQPEGRASRTAIAAIRSTPTTRPTTPPTTSRWSSPIATARAVRLTDVGEVARFGRELAQPGPLQRQAGGARHSLPPARRQHHRHGRSRSRRSCRNCRPRSRTRSTSS